MAVRGMTFDEKIAGLAEYWQDLQNLDPNYNVALRQSDMWYSKGSAIASEALTEIRHDLVLQVGCHARVQYRHRGFGLQDLQQDHEADRIDRVGILAIMTAPPSPEAFYKRAGNIAAFLQRIVAGETVIVPEFDDGPTHYREQCVAVDPSLPLFADFGAHMSNRTLQFEHQPPDIEGPRVNNRLLHIGFSPRFAAEVVVSAPVEAV